MDSDPQMERQGSSKQAAGLCGDWGCRRCCLFRFPSDLPSSSGPRIRAAQHRDVKPAASRRGSAHHSTARWPRVGIRALTLIPRLSGAGNPHRSAMTSSTRRPSASIRLWAEVWPSHTRCFGVSPKRTTTYTLTVTDANGKTATNNVEVKVR